MHTAWVAFYDELETLVSEVAARVERWTGHGGWIFSPGSAAAAEAASTEVRPDGSPWGERPVRTVYAYAQMETAMAVEMARCAALLIGAARPAPGIETVTRAALEAGSVTWWLLEEELTARQRVCRMQLLRRNSARELARSIKEVGEDLAVAGKETVPAIEAECRGLGLAPFTGKGNELEGQERPGYTARAKKFTGELGYQGAYSIYSGVAHGELAGVWRLFGETGALLPGRETLYSPIANPQATYAAADGAMKAMMGPVERIALLFGWAGTDRGAEIGATIDDINAEMKRLRP